MVVLVVGGGDGGRTEWFISCGATLRVYLTSTAPSDELSTFSILRRVLSIFLSDFLSRQVRTINCLLCWDAIFTED